MMVTGVQDVQQWLKSRWSVVVPEDWLEACIEWIHGENQMAPLSSEEVKNMVYEQWLVCDLQEIGASCLPPDCSKSPKLTLTGTYCLQMKFTSDDDEASLVTLTIQPYSQVNSIVDVSSSYYSQLQKVKGTENENALVTATQPTQPQWEPPKAGRLLLLKLTDGCQEIQAMEYKPIPKLTVSTTPGCKVVIRGPVLCRLGVMMLKSDNFVSLGGEVEALMEDGSPQQTLARELSRKEEESAQGSREQRKEFDVSHNPTPTHERHENQAPINRHSVVPVTGRGAPRSNVTQQSSAPVNLASAQCGNTARPSTRMNDFEDDDVLDHMDMEQLAAMETQGTTTTKVTTPEWEDDVDYDVLLEQMDYQDQTSSKKARRQGSNLASPSRKNAMTQPPPTNSRVHSTEISKAAPVSSNVNPGKIASSHGYQDRTSRQSFCAPVPSNDRTNTTASAPVKRTSWISPDRVARPCNVTKPENHTVQAMVDSRTEFDDFDDFEMEDDSLLAASVTTAIPGGEIHAELSEKPRVAAVTRCPSVKEKPNAQDIACPPFTYLKLVFAQAPPTDVLIFKVKAYISTLLSKLDHNNGSRWTLMVKINDGTAVIDADLSDQMLTSLIGFSAQECMELREKAKIDKAIKRRLTEGIRNCQQSLIQLSCILELELCPGQPRPLIQRFRMITAQDLDALRARASAS